MHYTKNDLPQPVRTQMVELLNQRVADSIDLMLQAKQAHWNVRGMSFLELHQLFDKVAESIGEYMDLLAERVAQLGGQVLGTVRVAALRSVLPEYPLQQALGRDHVEALSSAMSSFGKEARRAIATASEANDLDTADVLTEVSRGTDKLLWMVEAHLEGTP
ncbi:MAG TPA: DNA starvation/stationary phase protection protein Dps [Polyangiales bacterium]